MREYLSLFLKGIGMGAANVVPGVSGGTIALITGIFEELINSIKSLDIKALKLLFSGKFKEFSNHINLPFLLAVFIGIAFSIISIARLFGYLFENYPIYIWAYFFGLILASVYFVGKTIEKISSSVIITFIIGTAIAVLLSVLSPATQNDSIVYLLVCGVVAACSMILPGLSGSFVLILMGNYELVMINAVNEMNLAILIPVAIGAGVGMLAFSHFLSWVFKKFPNQTIAVLTGFILGSLNVLWPWKNEIYRVDDSGNQILKDGEPIIQNYQKYIPDTFDAEVIIAIVCIVFGIISIYLLEKLALEKKK